jgi:WD40 repeat protein
MKSLCDCVWAHDVALLATASDDQTVQIWDAESGRSLLCLRGHKGPVTSCDFNSTDTLIASASYDESIRLWDTKSGVCVARLPAHSDPVTSVRFSRDSTVLISCGYDGVCRLWDVHTTSCLQSMNFDVPLARVYAVESPSSVLVTTQQEDIFMWNIETGVLSNLHVKSDSRALRLLLTTDDDEIVFVDSRGAFWLWNISIYHLTCVAEPSTFRTLLESSTVVLLSYRKNILVTSCFSHDRINVWTV